MRALLLLLVLGGVAHARTVKPPAGWSPDPAAAVSLSKQLGELPHFGGLRSIVTTEVFQTKGGALHVTRMSANIAGLDEAARNRAASAQLDEVMVLAPTRVIGKAITDAANVGDTADPHALEGTHRWHDAETKIVSNSRVIVAADAQQMVAVIGECLFAADTAKEVDAPCAAALATLDLGLPPAGRVDLAIVKTDNKTIAESRGSGRLPEGSAASGPSLVDSGERPSLPPMQIPQEQREPDRRPIYVGLGLIVLAVIFYFNRKNREKLERDYEQRTADKKPPDKPEPQQKPDGDADDLHAAAADDGTKGEKS